MPELRSTLLCPRCEVRTTETMPLEVFQISYVCPACGLLMKPLEYDCCIFCSYGDVPCPAVQQGAVAGQDRGLTPTLHPSCGSEIRELELETASIAEVWVAAKAELERVVALADDEVREDLAQFIAALIRKVEEEGLVIGFAQALSELER
jgi:hypothetical protein